MPAKNHEDIRVFLNKYEDYAQFSNYVNSLLQILSDKSAALMADAHYEALLSDDDKATVVNNRVSVERSPVSVPVKIVDVIGGNIK